MSAPYLTIPGMKNPLLAARYPELFDDRPQQPSPRRVWRFVWRARIRGLVRIRRVGGTIPPRPSFHTQT